MTLDAGEFFGDAAIQDPYPLYARLRSEGPVHQVGDSGFHVVCSRDAVDEVIGRPDTFSSNLTASMTFTGSKVVPFEMDHLGGPSQVLATADDPSHGVHRKMLLPELAAKRIRALRPFMEQTFDQLWAAACRAGRIEWMALANTLPMTVVTRLIGAPREDVDQLAAWALASTQLLDGLIDAEGLSASGVAAMELAGYISRQFELAAGEPRDDLPGHLATACAAGDFDPMTAQMMLIILFGAGGESTASLLGTAMWLLATRPDVQQAVRSDPALLDAFIEETLRYEPPFRGHYRHVVDDTTVSGVPVPAGARLLLLWGAANRDPAHVDDPDEFRLDRTNPKAHLTFGRGAHFCVGAALARTEARVVLAAVLDRTDHIEATEVGRWIPSILVRRRELLELRVS